MEVYSRSDGGFVDSGRWRGSVSVAVACGFDEPDGCPFLHRVIGQVRDFHDASAAWEERYDERVDAGMVFRELADAPGDPGVVCQ